ncbi:MAG: serine/threonine protein kinase [Candidatus Obscuribacterales bacterium]|nr:serine/threonine protein kinase [Candidatus Obscuribacterales bacterium]
MKKPVDEKIKRKAADLVVDENQQAPNGDNGGAGVPARHETPKPVKAKVTPQKISPAAPVEESGGSKALEDPVQKVQEVRALFDAGQTFDGEETSALSDSSDKDVVFKELRETTVDAEPFSPNPMAQTADPVPISSLPSPQGGPSVSGVRDPLVGHVLDGKYEITRVVGHGGMSVVYEAKHLLMNKVIALKLMHAHLIHSEKAVCRFQKEAHAVAKLDHSGVIRIYDFGVASNGSPFIAMEFLHGKPLSESIKVNGRLEEDKAISVFQNIAEALEHAHGHGVIHRDLKPSNIVLTNIENSSAPPKPTVVDFGIAKMTGEDGEDQLSMTATGEVFGSPLYMSPEQCAGREMDQRSDIYSFGCLMYEAVTGKTPFEEKSAIALFHHHQKNEAPKFSTLANRPHVSDDLEGIILKCLEKHPLDRYQTMAELAKALQTLGARESVPELIRSKRRRNAILLSIALLSAVIGLILKDQWALVQGRVMFFALCLLICSWGAFSMIQRFFKMREAMRMRSTSLNFVQKVRLSFTLMTALIMSVWSVGMMVYVAAHATSSPIIDMLAQYLWFTSLILVILYAVGMIAFAAYTAITALSKETT